MFLHAGKENECMYVFPIDVICICAEIGHRSIFVLAFNLGFLCVAIENKYINMYAFNVFRYQKRNI